MNAIVTDSDIRTLRDEAAQAGDQDQVDLCDDALGGDDEARGECESVIFETRMQAEQ